jgi:hypothetical protein
LLTRCSGDISVDELKIGLSKLSIFMYPYELKEVCPRDIASALILSLLTTSMKSGDEFD